MLYTVDIFHNITTAREAADRGDEECATLIRAGEAYAAIPAAQARMSEPKARPGDRLRKVMTLVVEGERGAPASAAEAVFAAAGNAYANTSEACAYRAHGVRPLSTGDVVAVEVARRPWAFACEPFGWSRAALDDFKIED